MKKIELIRAIFELNNLKILNNSFAYKCVKEVLEKTITGTNKNFDIKTKKHLVEEELE